MKWSLEDQRRTRFMNAFRSRGGRCQTVAGPSNLPICLNIAATTWPTTKTPHVTAPDKSIEDWRRGVAESNWLLGGTRPNLSSLEPAKSTPGMLLWGTQVKHADVRLGLTFRSSCCVNLRLMTGTMSVSQSSRCAVISRLNSVNLYCGAQSRTARQ